MTAPDAVLVDANGNLYITDTTSHKVWKIDSKGIVSLVIGTGQINGPTDGKAANTQPINNPGGLALDAHGNLYVSDRGDSKIYKIDTTGVVTRYASIGNGRFSGDGRSALTAELNGPREIVFGPDGNLYIADTGNNRIRMINTTTGIITTVAGGGNPPTVTFTPPTPSNSLGDGGKATLAKLSAPEGVAFDLNGNMIIADTGNNRLRMVDTHGIITTIAGRDLINREKGLDDSGNPVKNPSGTGNLSAAAAPFPDSCPRPVVGVPAPCAPVGDGRDPLSALLASPSRVIVDANNNIIFSDRSNQRIRMILASTNTIQTIVGSASSGNAGDGGPGKSARINNPNGLTLDANGVLYFADRTNNRIRKLDTVAGIIGGVAGANFFNGDQAALQTMFSQPTGLAIDGAGNFYVADSGNNRIRKIDSSGQVTTIAGGGSDSRSDGIDPLAASMSNPTGIAVDPSGTVLYVADTGNNRIRRIAAGSITTVAGGGTFTADGLPATLVSLSLNSAIGGSANSRRFAGVAIGPKGIVYFAEIGSHVIRALQPDGTLVTVAGIRGTSGGEGDGGPAVSALLNSPTGVAVDSPGNVYFADTGNHTIRVISASNGLILPIAGATGSSNNDATTSAVIGYNSRLRFPEGVALDAAAANVFFTSSGSNDIMRESLSTLMNIRIGGNNNNSNSDFAFDYAGADGSAATSAQVNWPTGIVVDAQGDVFVADSANNVIRELIPSTK